MAFSRNPQIKLGYLVAPSGLGTQSKGETLELLLPTPAAACRSKQCEWRVAAEVVTYRRVEWAMN
jgi:hypothetical protein